MIFFSIQKVKYSLEGLNRFHTDRFKAVLLLWIIYSITVLSLLCFHACLFMMPCGHLMGLVCEVYLRSDCNTTPQPSSSQYTSSEQIKLKVLQISTRKEERRFSLAVSSLLAHTFCLIMF